MSRRNARKKPRVDGDSVEQTPGSSVSKSELYPVSKGRNGQPRGGNSRGGNPGSRGGSSDYSPVVSSNYFASNAQIVRNPQGHYQLFDGSDISTSYGSNPYRTSRQSLVNVIEYPQVNWNSFQCTAPGTVGLVPAQVSAYVTGLFQDIVNVMNFKGRFTPNQILGTAAHWPTWLNNYTICYSIVRSLQSVQSAMGLNTWFRSFSSAIAGTSNFDRIQFLAGRLEKVPVPPKLRAYLDILFGVFTHVDDDMVIVAHVNPNAAFNAVTDLSSTAAIATLLATVEATIPQIEGTATIEGNIINQVMAMTYGPVPPLTSKGFYTDPTLFDLHYLAAGQYRDTTNNLTYVAPLTTGSAGAPGIIPIPKRYGMKAAPNATLLRPQLYEEGGTAVASASPVGLLTWSNTSGNFSRSYQADGTTTTVIPDQGVAATVTPFNPTVDNYAFWWTELVVAGAAGIWQNDTRRYDRWDEFYMGTDRVGVATQKLLDDLVLTGINH